MIAQIKKILSSEFELELFEAALANLDDKKNKLRFHNFAYSIRELSTNFLHRLAPDESVRACDWFVVETENGNLSRRQRIKYAIQGGINDALLDHLGFYSEELNEEVKAIKQTIALLNKYTHIQPGNFHLSEKEVTDMSEKVLSDFKLFAQRIESYRTDLRIFLDGKIDEHMIMGVISNFYPNVDMLAPHHSVDESEISEYHIVEIDPYSIIVEVFGTVHFTLEYGSRKERREGDGLDLSESFPFQTKIIYKIDEDFPSDRYEIEEFDVDTQEWHEDWTDGEFDDYSEEEE